MSNIKLYDWIPFFAEVCCRLVEIGELPMTDKRDREIRNDKMEKLSRELFGDGAAIMNAKNLPANPFSFVYTLAAKKDTGFYKKVKEVMSLNAPAPTDLIFPTPRHNAAVIAPDGNVDGVWELFACTYRAKDAKEISDDVFVKFIKMRTVGLSSSTQCMFLINPCCYLPLDETGALAYLRKQHPNEFREHAAIEREVARGQLRFHELLERVRKHFVCLKPYEINLFAHLKVINPTVKKANLKVDEDDNMLVAEIEPYKTELARIEKMLGCKNFWQMMRHCRLYPCCLRRCRIFKRFHKK